ncbi:MAG: CaiB/BaiF CoA transferase family protein [Rubrivivax sp.]
MGPLNGLRVLEIAAIGPVPMAATLLADLGADVVRVDRPAPSGLGLPLPRQCDVHGRSRRSVAIDLKHPQGVDTLLVLASRSDVLLEGFRPGVAERLGIGPPACHARHPGLVYGRMTGFGQQGPLAQAAGHDLNYIALSGALHAIGPAGGAPVPPLNLVGDYGGGALYLAFGVMAALYERERSGRGQVVDAAMVDGAASLMGLFHGLCAAGDWRQTRASNLLDGGAPFYATYETADGRHVALAALEPKFFAELVRRIDLPSEFVQAQHDRTQWPRMRDAIAERIRTRTRDDWCARLEGSDACFAPVLSIDEVASHPHAVARGTYVDVEGVLQPAPAPRFDRSAAPQPGPAPEVGQHTDEVLRAAGFDDEALAGLRQAGAIR